MTTGAGSVGTNPRAPGHTGWSPSIFTYTYSIDGSTCGCTSPGRDKIDLPLLKYFTRYFVVQLSVEYIFGMVPFGKTLSDRHVAWVCHDSATFSLNPLIIRSYIFIITIRYGDNVEPGRKGYRFFCKDPSPIATECMLFMLMDIVIYCSYYWDSR